MNRKLFTKKILTLITAIALFVGVGLVYGFTSVNEKVQTRKVSETVKAAPANGWYVVNITNLGDPDNEANQSIGSLGSTPPVTDEFGCAQEDNDGNACMVYLTFQSTATTVPATIAAARAAGSLTTVGIKAESPE